MGSEAIVIPIIIDPKAGVAGLKALGDQAAKTNQVFNQGSANGGKFADSMKNIARNALTVLGAMNLAHGAVRLFVEGIIESIRNMKGMVTATELLQRAQKEAESSTRDEVIQLQLLYSAAKDVTLSYGQRQAAIDKINRAYPELHKNITLENILTNETAAAIQGVIDNLVRAEKLKILIKQVADLENSLGGLKLLDKKYGGGIFSLLGNAPTDVLNKTVALIAALRKEMYELQKQTIGSSNAANLLGAGAINVPKITVKPDKIELKRPKVFDVASDFNFYNSLLSTIKIPKKKFSMFDGSGAGNEATGKDTTIDDLIKKNEALFNLHQKQADMISGTLTPAFEGLFDAILTKQDALKAFFQSIMQSINQLIKQLIAAAIQAAVLSLISGGVSNAAKGGKSFSQAFGNILGFAEGGLVTGPVSALVGEGRGTSARNPEVVMPVDRLKNFFKDMIMPNRGMTFGSSMGTAGMNMRLPAYVELRADGRSLRGVMTLEEMSQGRNG